MKGNMHQNKCNVEVTGVESSILCSKIVCSLIKYILSQKKQIPYPYEYLQFIATKKSDTKEYKEYSVIKENRHRRKAVEFYNNLEYIFKGLDSELKNGGTDRTREVVLLLGATPVSPKEIYRIKLPPGGWSYSETWSKRELAEHMRCIVMDEVLQKIICKHVLPTNIFILIKKPIGTCSDWTFPKDKYSLPLKASSVMISLNKHEVDKDKNSFLDSCSIDKDGVLKEPVQYIVQINEEQEYVPKYKLSSIAHNRNIPIKETLVLHNIPEVSGAYDSSNNPNIHSQYFSTILLPISSASITNSNICDKLEDWKSIHIDTERFIASAFDDHPEHYIRIPCKKNGNCVQSLKPSEIKDSNMEMMWYQALYHLKAFKHKSY